MKKVSVFYGSTSGNTEEIANRIAEEFGVVAQSCDTMSPKDIAESELLILGSSTWGAGDLQDDWMDAIDTLKACDLSGKTVALFGCGDSQGFGDTFCDAIGTLYSELSDSNCDFVGEMDTAGYDYSDSTAIVDDKFVGCALDEENEPEKTDERIEAWIAQIKPLLN